MSLNVVYSDQNLRTTRSNWLTTFALVSFVACFFRLTYLQLLRGRDLEQASESNHTQLLVEHAPRGRIVDRNGMVLADDRPVFVALFSPLGLVTADFHKVVTRLAPILKVPPTELERRLFATVRAKSMLRISDKLTREQAFLILQDRTHLPGVSLTIEEQRYYPQGILGSHLMGYVGQVTDEELQQYTDEGYRSGDWIGKSGLERLYDPVLHGQDGGYLIEVDARGRQVRVLRHVPPQAGRDILLTLDGQLQQLAEKRLAENKLPGAAIVLNPQTGEVLTLASSPGFDPNLFLPLGDSEKRKALLSDPQLPLYNRAIQALYPPGSVFKIVTSMAGLESQQIKIADKVDCTGSFTLGRDKHIFHCWKLKGHGWMDFHQALSQSCDVYFYRSGLNIGAESIEHYAKLFGLGQKTGIDLPSEKRGLLPYAWKTGGGGHWQGGDTLSYAIGQGALQVTPLQMASLISTVATHGQIWQPFLVAFAHRLGHEEQERIGNSHLVAQLKFTENSWMPLREGLEEVVRTGTGVAAQLPHIVVAGKSGTAQATKGKEHAWFVAYAPAQNPQFACSVVVEHGGHGGSTAAPIVHDLLAMALGMEKQIPAASGEHAEVQGD